MFQDRAPAILIHCKDPNNIQSILQLYTAKDPKLMKVRRQRENLDREIKKLQPLNHQISESPLFRTQMFQFDRYQTETGDNPFLPQTPQTQSKSHILDFRQSQIEISNYDMTIRGSHVFQFPKPMTSFDRISTTQNAQASDHIEFQDFPNKQSNHNLMASSSTYQSNSKRLISLPPVDSLCGTKKQFFIRKPKGSFQSRISQAASITSKTQPLTELENQP